MFFDCKVHPSSLATCKLSRLKRFLYSCEHVHNVRSFIDVGLICMKISATIRLVCFTY